LRSLDFIVFCSVGAGDTMEKRTPYYGWRTIFEQLTDIEHIEEPDQRMKAISNILRSVSSP
jgi:hypothetical protein